MSTCNRLDLQTLGSRPVIMPKNLPNHWSSVQGLKSSMPFKCNSALQSILPLSKQPFKVQSQIENEDVTGSPQYNMSVTKTNKRRALSLQKVELDD